MICEENQFAPELIATWMEAMFSVVPDAEKAQITSEEWRRATLIALLEFWVPAGTC